MSIKSDNAELKQKIDALKNSNDISNFISDVSKCQKYYNSLGESCAQFASNFKKMPSSPSELASQVKSSFSKVDSNLQKLNNILANYQVGFMYTGIENEFDSFSYITSAGSSLPTKNYKDVINSILSRVNVSIKKFNNKIASVKTTANCYKAIAKNIEASANSLSAGSSQYSNNEIEVNGDNKLAHFRKRTKETSESFNELKSIIETYASKISGIKKIDVKDFSVSI